MGSIPRKGTIGADLLIDDLLHAFRQLRVGFWFTDWLIELLVDQLSA